jgi:hypothetical protein
MGALHVDLCLLGAAGAFCRPAKLSLDLSCFPSRLGLPELLTLRILPRISPLSYYCVHVMKLDTVLYRVHPAVREILLVSLAKWPAAAATEGPLEEGNGHRIRVLVLQILVGTDAPHPTFGRMPLPGRCLPQGRGAGWPAKLLN